ncbi:dihydrodipicolinate synthase family protein [Rugosimonospora africana]|uniref:Dihydrodipicolinate synthase family protein n=1 Tax=Rugosimonospora africana TaxID=556532 RepID=A0A8J3QR89_9ACTN|nr:dihydrodipicolinate synthase family protein [Rugosimonospora africana]GIH15076.1 dihydrodipicolinate synthase family protein [Rugosimonospora africana]
MKPLTAGELRGVWGTILLPLDDDDRIDEGRLADQLDALLAAGLDGVYAHGTAGEFITLDEDEYDRVSELLASACTAAGTAYQIGASHPGAQATLGRVRRAKHLMPGAFQVILPDWLRLHDDEVVAFVARAAEVADPVPLVLYNPPHAKTPVPPALLRRLCELVPSLIGVKMAGGDHDWFEAMRRAAPDCSIFVPGHTLASGIALGAHGSYSNIAAMSPTGAVRWYDIIGQDPDAGMDIERRIAVFFAQHVAPLQADGLSNPALDRFLAAVGAWADIGTRPRWPLRGAPDEAVAAARRTARRILPELFAH